MDWKLHGKYHNFLKMQGNNVKFKRPGRRTLFGAGWDIEDIAAWEGQVPSKTRMTLSQCPILVRTKPALYTKSLSLVFSVPHCLTAHSTNLLLSLPKDLGVGQEDLCEIRKQTAHSYLSIC